MASLAFQLLDDGKAIATLQTVDAAKNPIPFPPGASVPSWTSSDPKVTVTPAADGLTAELSDTGELATGVVITATSTLADGTSISGSGTVDVVADVNKPSGFTMSFQAE